ncbi:MAG: hypothetical protein IKP40_11155 [Clostridia bacterium]|nr:hypothetical protein [Clostridia bacterium]
MDAIQNKTPDTVKTHETELTLAELLRRLDALHTERDMLEKTVAEIRAFPNQENPQKLHAAVEVYAAHERTLQRELAFLEHLYDDRFSAKAKSPRQQERERVIESLIQGAAQASSPDIATQMLRLVSELMAHA